jgi:hypothetical protein
MQGWWASSRLAAPPFAIFERWAFVLRIVEDFPLGRLAMNYNPLLEASTSWQRMQTAFIETQFFAGQYSR